MAERSPSPFFKEDNQTVKMSQLSWSSPSADPEAIIQTGALFSPGIHDGLIKILNQLDPSSFVKFARTCKDLHYFCYNTKEIRVQYFCKIFARSRGPEIKKIGSDGRLLIRDISVQGLQKMPFIIVIKEIEFEKLNRPVDTPVLKEVRQMLRRLPGVVVEFVSYPDKGPVNWNDFIQFRQNYEVKRVNMWSRPVIPVDVLSFFLTKLDYFIYYTYVTDDLIVSAIPKYLRLPFARISSSTFINLLQKFVNEDIVYWEIGRHPYGSWHNPGHPDSDPFIQACSEVVQVVKQKHIYREEMEPSILYSRPSIPRIFFLRKTDGSIRKLNITSYCVFFDAAI